MSHIVVTGASSGIGAATARLLSADGHDLSLGARRVERLAEVVPGAFHARLDVTDQASIDEFLRGAVAAHGPIDVLINNAGLARGLERVAAADGVAWREMIETNLVGVLEITRRVVPDMVERRSGQIIMIGSIAGHENYENGSVYCATKHALRSFTQTLRFELLGTNVRLTSVDPGMVDTEFSLVRFRGDESRATKVYEGTRPLAASDVAECIAFAISRPPHVNLDTILVMPTDEASAIRIHRDA